MTATPTTPNDDAHTAALGYAAHGLRVVPIAPGKKYPQLEAWQDAASADPAVIDAWYSGLYRGHGVGLRLGWYGERCIFALDVDNASHGVDGQASLDELTDAYGDLPDTVEAITGSGGRHLLFWSAAEVRNGQSGRFGPGLDVRGEGGQIVVAPTIHPTSARPYAWVIDHAPGDLDIAEAPGWLLAHVTPAPEQPVDRPAVAPATPSPAGDRPGDRWAAATTWAEILEPDGWTLSHTDRRTGELHWTRPGKTTREGTSATTGYTANDNLKVFTSSVAQLDADGVYTKLGYLAAMRHGGDHQAAARALVADGWGTPAVGEGVALSAVVAAPSGAVGEVGEVVDPFELIEVDDLLALPEPEYRWIVPGLLERRDRLILTGPEGKGKSTLLRQIAMQLASGIHPFTLEEIDPLRVVVADVENSKPQVRRKLPALRAAAGDRYQQDCFFWFGPGLDLLTATDRDRLDQLLAQTRPDILLIGPIYKIAAGDPKDEQPARTVASFLDQIRNRYDLALLIEAHTPYAEGAKSARPERPYGASLWSRWPEFGVYLSPDGDLRHWRGQREERSWPAKVQRGGEWPWTVADGAEAGTTWDGPTHCMEAVLDFLERAGGEFSQRQLVDAVRAVGHPFGTPTIREAAERLALDGRIEVRQGSRGARIYRPRQTAPDRASGAVEGDGRATAPDRATAPYVVGAGGGAVADAPSGPPDTPSEHSSSGAVADDGSSLW